LYQVFLRRSHPAAAACDNGYEPMTKTPLLFTLLVSLAAGASAQSGRGYAFVAPGGRSVSGNTQATYYAGGGGELLLPKGIGAGVEAQAVLPSHRFRSDVFGVFSLNGYYHPLQGRRGDDKLDPFVTLGYALAFRTETANLWNYGAGLNYWFRDHLALLVEFRDHPWKAGPVRSHYWGFRFGFSFR
jgi:hypothetical protein